MSNYATQLGGTPADAANSAFNKAENVAKKYANKAENTMDDIESKAYKIAETTSDHALNKMRAAEQEELLMRAIDSLPEKCRQIFVLSRMNRLTNQEIATQLDLSIKTVEAQISIALKRLAQWIILLLIFFGAC